MLPPPPFEKINVHFIFPAVTLNDEYGGLNTRSDLKIALLYISLCGAQRGATLYFL